MIRVTARWLFPVARPPVERGVLVIDDRRIVAVEPAGPADHDFGNAAILPGFVNAHTHLDLSGMRGLAPPSPDFTDWLREVIAHRRQRSAGQVGDDIRAGLAESLRSGTTLVGDISGDGSSWAELADAPVRAVVFREMLGLPKDRAERSWQAAQEWLGSCEATATCRPGLSPHAPYSVRVSLLKAAAASGLPIATHLAESAAMSLLLDGATMAGQSIRSSSSPTAAKSSRPGGGHSPAFCHICHILLSPAPSAMCRISCISRDLRRGNEAFANMVANVANVAVRNIRAAVGRFRDGDRDGFMMRLEVRRQPHAA